VHRKKRRRSVLERAGVPAEMDQPVELLTSWVRGMGICVDTVVQVGTVTKGRVELTISMRAVPDLEGDEGGSEDLMERTLMRPEILMPRTWM